MKKFLSIFLCAVMMLVMVPSFFASAAEATAKPEAVVVAADDGGETTPTDLSFQGITQVLGTLWTFFSTLFKSLLGEDFFKDLGPALKKVLTIVSPGEFFKTVKRIFENIFNR